MKNKILIILVYILVALGLIGFFWSKENTPPPAPPIPAHLPVVYPVDDLPYSHIQPGFKKYSFTEYQMETILPIDWTVEKVNFSPKKGDFFTLSDSCFDYLITNPQKTVKFTITAPECPGSLYEIPEVKYVHADLLYYILHNGRYFVRYNNADKTVYGYSSFGTEDLKIVDQINQGDAKDFTGYENGYRVNPGDQTLRWFFLTMRYSGSENDRAKILAQTDFLAYSHEIIRQPKPPEIHSYKKFIITVIILIVFTLLAIISLVKKIPQQMTIVVSFILYMLGIVLSCITYFLNPLPL